MKEGGVLLLLDSSFASSFDFPPPIATDTLPFSIFNQRHFLAQVFRLLAQCSGNPIAARSRFSMHY